MPATRHEVGFTIRQEGKGYELHDGDVAKRCPGTRHPLVARPTVELTTKPADGLTMEKGPEGPLHCDGQEVCPALIGRAVPVEN